MAKERSFWSSIPGLLTGLAGVLTGVVGLLGLALSQGWLGDGPAEESGGGQVAEETGAPVVRISVDPGELRFTKVPGVDAAKSVTVTNDGNVSVAVTATTSGEDEASFTADARDCTRSEIPPDEDCTIEVLFEGGPSPSYRARLVVSANGNQDVQYVELTAASADLPDLLG